MSAIGLASERPDPREPFAAETASALRVVLVLTFDCASIEALLPADAGALWPSTLYAWAAETAVRSPVVWRRCALALDHALAPWLAPFERVPLAAIMELVRARDGALSGAEIAAALWTLVRRRDPALAAVAARLASEAEIGMVRAFTPRAAGRSDRRNWSSSRPRRDLARPCD